MSHHPSVPVIGLLVTGAFSGYYVASNQTFTLSRNLRLRLDNNLSANSRYNLERLDLIGTAVSTDTSDSTNILSRADVIIEPESQKIGGSGIGGTVSIGTSGHALDAINLFAAEINVPDLGLFDQASSGNKYLRLRYNSALHGSVDTAFDRILSIDLDGYDRSLILGGDLSLTGGSLAISLSGDSVLQFPLSGTLATLDDVTPLPSQVGQAGKVLQTDGTTTHWATVSGSSSVQAAATNWTAADGTSKTFAHGLGSLDIDVSIVDSTTSEVIQISSVVRTDLNTVTLTASEAPAASWRVVVQA